MHAKTSRVRGFTPVYGAVPKCHPDVHAPAWVGPFLPGVCAYSSPFAHRKTFRGRSEGPSSRRMHQHSILADQETRVAHALSSGAAEVQEETG
jgi:hypothetical protein